MWVIVRIDRKLRKKVTFTGPRGRKMRGGLECRKEPTGSVGEKYSDQEHSRKCAEGRERTRRDRRNQISHHIWGCTQKFPD